MHAAGSAHAGTRPVFAGSHVWRAERECFVALRRARLNDRASALARTLPGQVAEEFAPEVGQPGTRSVARLDEMQHFPSS